MNIQAFPSGPFVTNAYVFSCPATSQAAIIDPAPDCSQSIIDYLTKHSLVPTKILVTHSHWDHIADIANLKRTYQIPVYIHAFDAGNLENPGSDGLPTWLAIEGVKPDHLIVDKEIIPVGKFSFEVIETPGHTPGGVCFYCKEEKALFTGDTLFKSTIGNLSFPTARPHLMWDSLSKLAKLPPDTIIYPGHGPSTTIGAEKWLDRAEELFGD